MGLLVESTLDRGEKVRIGFKCFGGVFIQIDGSVLLVQKDAQSLRMHPKNYCSISLARSNADKLNFRCGADDEK